MNANSKKLGIYLGIASAITAACVALRTAACLNDLDYRYGYFENKQLIDIADILIWCGAVFMLTYFFSSVRVKLRPSFTGPSTYIASGAVCVALLFFSRRLFEIAAQNSKGGEYIARIEGIFIPLTILIALFALMSIGHFAANVLLSEAKAEIRGYLTLFTLLTLSFYAAFLYFSTDLPINAPNKLCDQMAFLFSAIFFLYEARISLGREKWRAYSSFGLIALMFTAYSSIPSLLTYFIKGETISAGIEENILTLTLMFFIGSRLLLVLFMPEEKENEAISVLREVAQSRTAEVMLTETRFAEKYAVQMNFNEIIDRDIALEMEDGYSADESPVSEAESFLTDASPETFFDEDMLLDADRNGQIALGYELLTPGDAESGTETAESQQTDKE